MQNSAPTVTTAELRHLVASAEPLWLVYVPDDPASSPAHIAGSLATTDDNLLAGLAGATPMVLYGEDSYAVRARTLAARLASEGGDARWYVGGLEAWTAANLPVEGRSGSGEDLREYP